MLKPQIWVALAILVAVVGIAAWSKLRYVDREGYDNPTRWKVSEYPSRHQPVTGSRRTE